MIWWVLIAHDHHPGVTTLDVFSATNNPDHLWMSWAHHRPAQHEIWKIVRGKHVFCGYRYVWDTPNIEEQIQPGDTIHHHFYLSGLEAASEVWYYLHAPYGPGMREIQGPLMHVHLLAVPTWSTRAYFASRTKGMFKTANLSGPGGPHPTWIPDNAGLPFLDIRQACSDPADPYHSRFIICHGDLYRMENIFIDEPALATRVLAEWEAVALTGGFPGEIVWIAPNPNLHGHFYVLFWSKPGGTGFWCLKTIDYGQSWTAYNIHDQLLHFRPGNIQTGTAKGSSLHPAGDVLYASLSVGAGGILQVSRSTDEGESWHPTSDQPPSGGPYQARLHIDPTDQTHVYVGAGSAGEDLWRTLSHGAAWSLCDQGNHLGIAIGPIGLYATMHTDPADPDAIRVLTDRHIWKSNDWGQIWRDQAETQYDVHHLHVRDDSYDFLYLATVYNAPTTGALYRAHVIFVSDDEGSNMFGKAGPHADQDDGAGDSIPWNCGGVANEGILTLP